MDEEFNKLDKDFRKLELFTLDFDYDNVFLYYRDGKYCGFCKKGKRLPSHYKKRDDKLIAIIPFVDREKGKKKVLHFIKKYEKFKNKGRVINIDITDNNLDIIISLVDYFDIIINPNNALIIKKDKSEETLRYLKKIKNENGFNTRSFNSIKKKILYK